MSVICHQAPRQNLSAEAVELPGENRKIHTTILIGAEDGY